MENNVYWLFFNLVILTRTSRKHYANTTLHNCTFQIAQNGGSQIYEKSVFGFLEKGEEQDSATKSHDFHVIPYPCLLTACSRDFPLAKFKTQLGSGFSGCK